VCYPLQFDNASVHIQRAKSHDIHNTYDLGCAMDLQAYVWCLQRGLEDRDAKSEALRALEIFEKPGVVEDAGICRDLFH
jgi:hypothetical protein